MGASQSQTPQQGEQKKMSEAEVREIIASANVVLFTDPTCPYCVEAVNVLKSKSIEHKVVVASSAMRASLRSMTGQSSVPNCWVKGVFAGGCNDGPESWHGIKKMANNGELARRLSA